MTLIIGQNNLKAEFLANWKYVPVILQYGERSSKASVKQQVDETGMYCIVTYYKPMMYYKPTPVFSSKFLHRYRTLMYGNLHYK